jgi:endonuclease III
VAAKTETVGRLLEQIELGWSVPTPVEDATLLEQGVYAVLCRHLDEKRAAAALKHLKGSYEDWNEVRVAQAQEIVEVGKLGARGTQAARDVKTFLQEVFQQTHGLSLEFLKNDAQATTKFISAATFLGLGSAHYLMWLAQDGELPITAGLVRVLDRVGLVGRTTSTKKARSAIQPLVPASLPGKLKGGARPELEFLVRFGEVASRWCDARKPLCHLCVLVDDCKYGKKAYKDWKVQQERLEAQRAREAAREEAARKKEEARLAREEERARKKALAEAQKKQRELERRRKLDEKKKDAEAKKKARADAVRKREQDRKEAARQKTQAAKAAKKKVTTAKKKPVKKATKKKTSTSTKASRSKTTRKKTTRKAPRKPARKK